MISSEEIIKGLDKLIPNPKCELLYNKDYELLIATVLSAQCTDKRVNMVTRKMFSKYNLECLSKLSQNEIIDLIRTVGTYERKSYYVKTIVTKLLEDCNGIVPNNREYLESLPGVGRKTANVVLSNLFDEPAIAVDTHVARVSKRLGIANKNDDVKIIEEKLMHFFPKENWSRLHHQLVLFGRYYCQSRNPKCENCIFKEKCQQTKI